MKNSKSLLFSVFCVAASVLMYEVSLTRVFSVMLWYHFAYIVISLCLLGLGASGTFLSIYKIDKESRSVGKVPLIFSIVFPLTMIFCFLLASKILIEPLNLIKDKSNIVALFFIYILMIIPFFCSGTILGYVFMKNYKYMGRLYFWDLFGAGIGAVIVAFAINIVSAPAAIMIAALLASIGAVAFNIHLENRIKFTRIILLPIFCILSIVVFMKWDWYIAVPSSKELYWSQQDPDVIEYSKWTTIARVDVVWEGNYNPTFGADVAPRFFNTTYRSNFIAQDGVAPTLIFKVDKDKQLNDMFPFLKYTTQSGAYRIIEKPKVCIVGIGGGMDILVALGNESKEITAVEINPAMVYLCREKYAEKTNNVFNDKRITWVNNEGRHFLASTKEKFDIIQMSGVDTFAALASGAYVLSENYLYTTDAIKDVHSRLNDDGIYSVSRWFFDPPRETLRLAVIVHKALEELGVKNPEKHIMIIHGPKWGTILMKKSEWTEEQIQTLRGFVQENEFATFFDPYKTTVENPFEQYLRADEKGRKEFINTYRFNVSPISDNKPFFFQYYRWKEILGLSNLGFQSILGYFITQTPQAFKTLAITLVQLVILSFFLILYPLKRNREVWRGVRGKFGLILYFSALGLGFIMIEIILIQWFIVYLGAPMYSISTVLAGLLIFSGIGSMITMRFKDKYIKHLGIVFALLCLVIIFSALFIKPLIDITLKQPLLIKAIVTLIILAPLGLLMGMPFPTGIKLLGERDPALVPWAWAINGCLSVISTMLSILLSSFIGFQMVFILAAGVYILGYLGIYLYILKNPYAVHN